MADHEEAKPPEAGDGSEAQGHKADKHEPDKKAKFLRVRVVDNSKDGRPAVNIKVPIGVVKFGMKMAQAFSPEVKNANVDWDSITEMIHESEVGKIVEVEDEAAHKTIDVWVE